MPIAVSTMRTAIATSKRRSVQNVHIAHRRLSWPAARLTRKNYNGLSVTSAVRQSVGADARPGEAGIGLDPVELLRGSGGGERRPIARPRGGVIGGRRRGG